MRLSTTLGLLPLASAGYCDNSKPIEEVSPFADPSIVCNLLKQQYGNLTYLPNDEGYQNETQGTHSKQYIPLSAIYVSAGL